MNKQQLRTFLESLTPQELKEVKEYLKNHKKREKRLTIKDLIRDNSGLSIRLFNSLELYSKTYPYVEDLVKHRFLLTRNTGERSWEELTELLSTKYGIKHGN